MSDDLTRRSLLQATLALGIGLTPLRNAHARGRTAVGGRISLRVPWPVLAMDPHRLEDATAGIFGEALFDTLYLRDESGAFVASLAEGDPVAATRGAKGGKQRAANLTATERSASARAAATARWADQPHHGQKLGQ